MQNYGDVRERFSSEGNTIDYMIDCFYDNQSEKLFLFAGSYGGDMVMFQPVPNDLIHVASLAGGHNDVVRSVVNVPNSEFILSGAEDGRVCQWESAKNEDMEGSSDSDNDMRDHDEPIYLSGKNLRKKELREKFKYVLNPNYLPNKK